MNLSAQPTGTYTMKIKTNTAEIYKKIIKE
ncbi:hypothetical protein [Chryseobacterium luteum]